MAVGVRVSLVVLVPLALPLAVGYECRTLIEEVFWSL